MAVKERQYFILRGTVQRQKLDEDIERILSLYKTTASSRCAWSGTTPASTATRPG